MAIDFNQNHFELFGLPVRFEIDADRLDRAWRDLQQQVHPDRFATAAEADRRLSMQWSTRVNEGYQTLKDPLLRAGYLLQLAGIDPRFETDTRMPADFLTEQMEWRESVEQASDSKDTGELEILEMELARETKDLLAELGEALDRGEHESAAGTLRKLKFFEKLRDEIDAALETAGY